MGGIIVAVSMFIALVVKPYARAFAATGNSLTTQRTLLERERKLAGKRSQFPALIARARSSMQPHYKTLFEEVDELDAVSALADYATEMAIGQGLDVASIDPLDISSTTTSLKQIGVKLTATGTFDQILRTLRSFETGPRLLRIAGIRIATSSSGNLTLSAVVYAMAIIKKRKAITASVATSISELPRDPFTPVTTNDTIPVSSNQGAGTDITPPIELLGTVMGSGTQSFAMCSIPGVPLKTLHVGDTLGPYKLIRIHQAAADFKLSDGTVQTIHVPRGGDK